MPVSQQTYVRYSDEVEVKQPHEDEQTRQVVESMARVNAALTNCPIDGTRLIG